VKQLDYPRKLHIGNARVVAVRECDKRSYDLEHLSESPWSYGVNILCDLQEAMHPFMRVDNEFRHGRGLLKTLKQLQLRLDRQIALLELRMSHLEELDSRSNGKG